MSAAFSSMENLRLAARAMIEWRTPKDATAYQEILREILLGHPIADSVGIHKTHPILEYDDQGILLCYLSDTMELPAPSIAELDLVEFDLNAELSKAVRFLSMLSTMGAEDEEFWP